MIVSALSQATSLGKSGNVLRRPLVADHTLRPVGSAASSGISRPNTTARRGASGHQAKVIAPCTWVLTAPAVDVTTTWPLRASATRLSPGDRATSAILWL